MTLEKLRDYLIVVLAIIPAIVAAGLIAGYSMWGFIVGYWIVLEIKNLIDRSISIKRRSNHDSN